MIKGVRLLLALLLVPATQGTGAPPPAAASAPTPFALQGVPEQGALLRGTVPVGTVELRLGDQNVSFDADRRFIIAFDRDAPATARLEARLADGRSIAQPLSVAPRVWRIERIDAPMRPTKDTAAFLARRLPELERIAAARAVTTAAQGWRQPMRWPQNGRISGLFGAQRAYRGTPGAFHGGVDIAGPTGTPVMAPADGVVVLAATAPFSLEGNLLIIDHGHGLNSAFLHLSRIDVAAGDRVAQGQRVGAIGATGRATGPHLHWSMKWNAARIDPMLLAGPMTAR